MNDFILRYCFGIKNVNLSKILIQNRSFFTKCTKTERFPLENCKGQGL